MVESLPTEIVRAVADAKGCEPTDLEYALEEYVPTDALEQLAARAETSWTFSFELPEHNVTVTSDGLILVDGAREEVWT